MRAGGHYHYGIQQESHYKNITFANQTTTYQAVKLYMTPLQVSSGCSKATCALVSATDLAQVSAGNNGLMAKF